MNIKKENDVFFLKKNKVTKTFVASVHIVHPLKVSYKLTDYSVAPTFFTAGWSSLVARQAHNLKVAGSNPAPATLLRAAASGLALRRAGPFPREEDPS